MNIILTVLHVSACIFLVLVVLLQTGKGADMGAVFGGSSSTVFGSSGAGNFLTRLTTATAILFMLTSLGLTYLSSRQGTATIFDSAPVAEQPAPASQQGAAPAAQPQGAAPDIQVVPKAAAPDAQPQAPAPAPQPQAAAPAAQPEAPAPAAQPQAAAPASQPAQEQAAAKDVPAAPAAQQ